MSNDKKLLRECYGLHYDKKMIKEAAENQSPIIVPVLFGRVDFKNANGRIYPRAIMERELNKYQQMVQDQNALGSLDHPDEDPVVSLSSAAILVKES